MCSSKSNPPETHFDVLWLPEPPAPVLPSLFCEPLSFLLSLHPTGETALFRLANLFSFRISKYLFPLHERSRRVVEDFVDAADADADADDDDDEFRDLVVVADGADDECEKGCADEEINGNEREGEAEFTN